MRIGDSLEEGIVDLVLHDQQIQHTCLGDPFGQFAADRRFDTGFIFHVVQDRYQVRRFGRQPEIKFQRTIEGFRKMGYAAVGLGPDVGLLSPAELSGGMRKRVGLARAIATSPDIIFFDEPTTGLDPIMGDVIDELIVKCVRELGATALSITHDMASARKISDRIAMLYDGKIIWAGPTAEIDRSNNPYVDQFIHGRAEGPIASMVNA